MIEVKNLTKCFGRNIAVDNISFSVEEGEIVGFLGPNGAGKTTTMNIMTGLISSTDGNIRINGFDILEEPEKAKKNIGYLPDNPPLYDEMKTKEYLFFVCDLKNIKKSERKEMINDIMETFKITDVKDRLLKNLSKGYKQRVGLAQALIGYPKVLILDEPMVGLDPKQIVEMRDIIKRLNKKHTIILSSHILSEVGAVCDRVIIINKGKIVASDNPGKLSDNLLQGHKIAIRVKGNKDKIRNILKDIDIVKSVSCTGSKEKGTYDFNLQSDEGTDIREPIFLALSKNNLPIYMMKSSDLSLEEIFIQITDREGGSI